MRTLNQSQAFGLSLLLMILSSCSNARFFEPRPEPADLGADSQFNGATGLSGAKCWDALTEDQNGDGVLNILDCEGEQGRKGLNGNPGMNGQAGANGSRGSNGQNGRHCFENTGDTNGDGVLSASDCRGPRGMDGLNGLAGSAGMPGQDCFNNLVDRNGDGTVTSQDCRGLPGLIDSSGIEVIGCSSGFNTPGGVDPNQLSTLENPGSGPTPEGSLDFSPTFGYCSKGKRLIAAGLVGSEVRQGYVALPDAWSQDGAFIEHGVAIGRTHPNDPYPNKIHCFMGDRNGPFCPNDTFCGNWLFGMSVYGWGLCVPIVASNQP